MTVFSKFIHSKATVISNGRVVEVIVFKKAAKNDLILEVMSEFLRCFLEGGFAYDRIEVKDNIVSSVTEIKYKGIPVFYKVHSSFRCMFEDDGLVLY